jgi:hypothetical protein
MIKRPSLAKIQFMAFGTTTFDGSDELTIHIPEPATWNRNATTQESSTLGNSFHTAVNATIYMWQSPLSLFRLSNDQSRQKARRPKDLVKRMGSGKLNSGCSPRDFREQGWLTESFRVKRYTLVFPRKQSDTRIDFRIGIHECLLAIQVSEVTADADGLHTVAFTESSLPIRFEGIGLPFTENTTDVSTE